MRIKWPALARSLQSRLLLASVLLLPLIFLSAWQALQLAYQESLERALQERLQSQIYLLLGAADIGVNGLSLPEQLQDPRFSQPASGLYGMVQNEAGDIVWRSTSSALLDLQALAGVPEKINPGALDFRHRETAGLYQLNYSVIWSLEGQELRYVFSVLQQDSALLAELKTYRNHLLIWMALALVIALLVQFAILRWGLVPLQHLARDIRRIEQGQTEQLSGAYPSEVLPVTANINRLLEYERQQRERYRNTLGNLAHSLKTPLAVLRGLEAESLTASRYQARVDEQVARMDQIVQYQLARAVQNHAPVVTGQGVVVASVVQRLFSALAKVYRDKHLAFSVAGDPAVRFAGDERDLLELLGNLLENACKYGDQTVKVCWQLEHSALEISIEDDGPGVPAQQRQTILERGARGDTAAPGQGIGLAVATDIVSSYRGAIQVEQSALGGASFKLVLPGRFT